ncbi:MAG: hypothetical protein RL385_2145 [Pseudomonadota bacterium]
MRKLSAMLVAAISLFSTNLADARAPDTFEEDYHPPVVIDSPMWVTWEFRFGQYTPDTGAFRDAFPSDKGWLYGAEVDLTAYTIPYVGQLAGGLGFGWAKYTAKAAVIPGGEASGETTKLTLFPVSALGVLRIDGLARHTKVPLTFAAKLGADFLRWKAARARTRTGRVSTSACTGLCRGLLSSISSIAVLREGSMTTSGSITPTSSASSWNRRRTPWAPARFSLGSAPSSSAR